MRVLLLFLAWMVFHTPAYTQILALKVGMSEKDMVRSAMPSRIEPSIEFVKREGDITTFHQSEDSTYSLTIFITTKRGKIFNIRKRYVASSVDTRRILFYNFSEKLKSRKNTPGIEENERLAHSVAKEFIDKGVRAKAYNHKKRSITEVLMFYNNKTSSVYIEIEQKS